MSTLTKQHSNFRLAYALACLLTCLLIGFALPAQAQNNALNFDGGNDFVSIPHNAALKPATNVTVEAWIFATDVSGIRDIIRKEDGNDRILFSFQSNGTILSFGLGVGGTYSELDVTIIPSDYLNRWVHIAAVYDGTQKIIYRNGVVIGTETVSGAIGTAGTSPLLLSSENGGFSFFNGTMDEFRFWNVARTQAQIQSGMTSNLAGTESGLVVYYNFNEGVANANNTALTTVNDLATTVGGTNNGTLTNFARTGTTSNWVGGQVFAPGGVSTNLKLWLKADAGVTQTTGVSQWNDQSPNGLNAVSGVNPTFVASGLNFNPTILFNGTSHRLATASTSLFSSNSSPVSFFTVFNTTNNSGQRFLVNQRFNNNCATNIQLGYTTGFGGVGNYGLHTGCGNAAVAPDGTIPNNTYQMMSTLILNTGTTPANINTFRNGASVSVSNNGAGYTSAGSYETSTQNVPIEIGVRNDAYLGSSYNGFHVGNIGEIIIYTSTPTAIERRQVESYLALKYGLTIDQTTATDYLASNGTTEMWDKDLSGASTYRNNIAGIGRDNLSALNQKQSRSINANTPLTIGLGTVATTNALNTNTFANDRRFLTWADNNTALASVSTTDVPNASFPRRMARIWQAQEPNGDVGNTQVVLDITGTGLTGASASNFVLLLDNDATFNNGITSSIIASSLVGNIVTFNNVNFTNGQYFTFANFTGTTTSAVRGNMMSFDGVNDFINAGDINALDGVSQITLETWLYIPTGTWPTSGMIMSKQDGGSPSSFNRIELSLSGGSEGGTNDILVVVGGSPTINANYYTNTDAIQYNTWYHVAMVFDGTLTGDANRLKLYVNGVQQSMTLVGTSVPALTPSTNSGALCMGTRQGGTLPFRGSLDEARVWNTARTQAQIRESMHLTLSGAETGLLAYYQFNETSGNAIDAVAGNHGTLNGATRIESTVSVAKGVATRLTVNSPSTQTFGNATVTFTAMTAPATNDEFVTYQLYDRPLNNVSATNTASNYWIVRQFGTQTFSYNQTSFTLPASNVISTTAPASDMKLFKRNHNSGGVWGTAIGTASSANNTTKVIDYNLSPTQTSFSEFAVASVTSPLPITLLGLKGERVEKGGERTEEVRLEWSTASEINNKGFEIQVSENAQTFKSISFVEGKGNTTTVSSYQLAVSNPDDAYYRLKQMDFDGKFSYSPIVFVEGMETLVVYPNPNNGTFKVVRGTQTTADKLDLPARLLNTQGIEVWRGVQTEVKTNLPAGMYFLHTTVAGKAKVTKIIIEH